MQQQFLKTAVQDFWNANILTTIPATPRQQHAAQEQPTDNAMFLDAFKCTFYSLGDATTTINLLVNTFSTVTGINSWIDFELLVLLLTPPGFATKVYRLHQFVAMKIL